MAAAWYYVKGEERKGPVSSADLKTLATSGELLPDDLVWKEGMEDWRPASDLKGLFPEQPAAAIPAAAAPATSEPAPQPAAPAPAAGPAPVQQPLAAGFPIVNNPVEFQPVIQTTSAQSADRKYPTMMLASAIYRVFGWIVIALASLGGVVYLISMIEVLSAASQYSDSAAIVLFFTQILILLAGIVYVVLTVVTLWFFAEAIKCVVDIQSNTQRSANYLQQLLERDPH